MARHAANLGNQRFFGNGHANQYKRASTARRISLGSPELAVVLATSETRMALLVSIGALATSCGNLSSMTSGYPP